MELSDVQKYFKKAKKEALEKFISKLYEKGDEKTKKKVITAFVPKKERLVPKIKAPDPYGFFEEVKLFQEYAKEQYYFAPNRFVSKKERSGWRSYVKQLLGDSLALMQAKEYKVVYQSLEIILSVLDKGTRYHVFVSTRPFDASRTDPKLWCGHMFKSFLHAHNFDYQKLFAHFVPFAHLYDLGSEKYESNVFMFLLDLCKTRDLEELYYLSITKYFSENCKASYSTRINKCEFIMTYDKYSEIHLKFSYQGKKKYNQRLYFSDTKRLKWYKDLSDEEREAYHNLYQKALRGRTSWELDYKIKDIIPKGIQFFLSNHDEKSAKKFVFAFRRALRKGKFAYFVAYFCYQIKNFDEVKKWLQVCLNELPGHSDAKDLEEKLKMDF